MNLSRLIAALTIALPAAALEAKTWTDSEGRTIEAELVRYSPADDSVTIRRGTREFTVPLSKFVQEDQTFVRGWFQGMVQARSATIKDSIGLFPEWKLKKRAFARPQLYLEGDLRSQAAKAYEPGDGPSIDAVTYDIENQTAALFVPPNYDGITPFGVYVFISASQRGWTPNDAYQSVLEKHRLISISAYSSGNDATTFRRMALAVDSLASVHADYEVDPKRFYVGGASGGGTLATHTAFFYPEMFRASFNMVRGNLLKNYQLENDPTGKYQPGTYGAQWPFLKPGDIRGVAARHPEMRWAFLSGLKDYNYVFTKVSADQWRQAGFTSRFFDVPDMGHTIAPPEWFEEALLWVERK